MHSASTVVSDLLPDIDRLVERLSDVALRASFLARQVPERSSLSDVGVTLQVDRPTVLNIEPGSIVWRVESVRLVSLECAPSAQGGGEDLGVDQLKRAQGLVNPREGSPGQQMLD